MEYRERVFIVSMLENTWFNFPQPIPLEKKLKDMLEDDVDEKYYIAQDKVDKFLENLPPEQLEKLMNG